MKQIAEAELGGEVSKAVITVPAYFNDNQRQATKDAGRIAGLEVLRILNEPTAAALAYGYGRDITQRVAVYDFGGGTFDVSVLEIGKDVFEVLSTCGDTFLGGDDFDDRLIDLLAEKVQAEHSVDPRGDPIAFEKLKQAAERGKIGLSLNDSSLIEVPDLLEIDGATIGVSHELTRGDFNKLVNDLIMRTFKVCDEAMQEAGLTNRDIEGIILVGGPTRLPTIRNAVQGILPAGAGSRYQPGRSRRGRSGDPRLVPRGHRDEHLPARRDPADAPARHRRRNDRADHRSEQSGPDRGDPHLHDRHGRSVRDRHQDLPGRVASRGGQRAAR